jgi:hypothetical protein
VQGDAAFSSSLGGRGIINQFVVRILLMVCSSVAALIFMDGK